MADFDAIVIGSGMGGLATAAILARVKKMRVLILERHFRAGGFTHTFKRPGGYRWDVGLHYVGEMDEGSRGRMLLDFVTGSQMEWNPMPEVYDRFLYPGLTFNVPKGVQAFRSALISQFPAESKAVIQYFADVKRAVRFAQLAIVSGGLPPGAAGLIRLANRLSSSLALGTTRDYVENHFRDPRLKAVLASQWLDYGLPPSQSAFVTHALIVNHYLEGAWYPEGGSGVIAEGAQKTIEKADGCILLNHEVDQIVIENGQVMGVDAQIRNKPDEASVRFNSPIVISDAGAWNTFQKLVPPTANIPFRHDLDEMVSAKQPGCAAVTLYLGLDRDPRCMGFKGENYWLFEGFDHEAMFSDQDELLKGKPHSLYLSFPSLKEKHEKNHTAEVIAPLSYASVQEFSTDLWRRRPEPYQRMKETMSEAMLDAVDRRFPGFSKMVVFSELSTPLSVEYFTAHPRGALYGVPATPDRYRKSWLKPDTPIKGLYLTGTDAGSLGIMGALMGGVAAAARIIGPFGLFSIMAAATKSRMKMLAEQKVAGGD